MKLRILSTTLIALATWGQMLGQQPAPPSPTQQNEPDDDVVRISTNLVQLDAVVTDGNGRPVNDLGPLDFEVLEDGRPQQITNLSYILLSQPTESSASAPAHPKGQTPLPVPSARLRAEQVRRTVALVVDDLGLSFESTAYVTSPRLVANRHE
jgi:VWFA-related protein